MQARGLEVVSDDGALLTAVDAAIAANPDVAQKIRDGKVPAAGALIGAVMKDMSGQADAARVRGDRPRTPQLTPHFTCHDGNGISASSRLRVAAFRGPCVGEEPQTTVGCGSDGPQPAVVSPWCSARGVPVPLAVSGVCQSRSPRSAAM